MTKIVKFLFLLLFFCNGIIDYNGTYNITIQSGTGWGLKYNVGSCNQELWRLTIEIDGTAQANEGDLFYAFGQNIGNSNYFAFANAFDDTLVIGTTGSAFITPTDNGDLHTANMTELGEQPDYRSAFGDGRQGNWDVVLDNEFNNIWPVIFYIDIDTYQGTTKVRFRKNGVTSNETTFTSTWDTSDNDLYLYMTPDDFNGEIFEIYSITILNNECNYFLIPYDGIEAVTIKSNPGWSIYFDFLNSCPMDVSIGTLVLNGDRVTPNGNLVFAITTDIQYIAFILEFSGLVVSNWMISGIESGDIVNVGESIDYRSSLTSKWTSIQPIPGNSLALFPITIDIFTDHTTFIELTLHHASTNDTIRINGAFGVGKTIRVYITPDDAIYSEFSITGISIVNPICKDTTIAPTSAPSTTPSNSPSGGPTKSPTLSPSPQPTVAPTEPTLIPTTSPTASPTVVVDVIKGIIDSDRSCDDNSFIQGHCPSCLNSFSLYGASSSVAMDLSINSDITTGCQCPNDLIDLNTNESDIFTLQNSGYSLELTEDIENSQLLLTVYTWNSIELPRYCQLVYFVNSGSFSGIVSKNVIHITFFVYNIDWTQNEQDQQEVVYQVFFRDVFEGLGYSVTKVIVLSLRGDFDGGNLGVRRRLFADNENDVQVDVFIFLDSTDDAVDAVQYFDNLCQDTLNNIPENTPKDCEVTLESADITPYSSSKNNASTILGARAWVFWLALVLVFLSVCICLIVYTHWDNQKDKKAFVDSRKRNRAISNDINTNRSTSMEFDVYDRRHLNQSITIDGFDPEYAKPKDIDKEINDNDNDDDMDVVKQTKRLSFFKRKKIEEKLSDYTNQTDMIKGIIQKKKANKINFKELNFTNSKVLGKGAFGVVKVCRWFSEVVAVKVLNDDEEQDKDTGQDSLNSNGNAQSPSNSNSKRRHTRTKKEKKKEKYAEIILANTIPFHPNLVQYFGYVDKPLCMVMEYMKNGSVQDYIYRNKQNNALSNIEKIVIYKKAAAGIEFLHEFGCMHRDIAARNILLSDVKYNKIKESTTVKISDFGLTRKLEEEEYNSGKTETNYGPVKWMAPESIRNKEYSKKSDIYMFGITMWEIWYRMAPYPNTTTVNVGIRVASNNPKHFRPRVNSALKKLQTNKIIEEDMPDFVKDIMERCWDYIPEHRPSFSTIIKQLKKDDISRY